MNLRLLSALFVLAFLAAVPARADITTTAEHGILVDYDSGQVLWAKDAFSPMPPASMSKLMTLELLFQRLKDGRVKLTDTFPVSERAWSTQGSKMFVEIHGNIPVEALIRGIIVDSGNDACMVVAEGIGGTMEGFVAMMNRRTGVVTQTAPVATRLYVQAGAFTTYQNAARLVQRLGNGLQISSITHNGQTVYRVRSGPYDDIGDADSALARVTAAGSNDARIVVDN